VKQWVTFHGFALNVTTELSHFDLIVPCGLEGVTMTSVARERPGLADPWTATRGAVIAAFGAVFERELREQPGAALRAMSARS
jgi:lipoyl(octanoyl) transferase